MDNMTEGTGNKIMTIHERPKLAVLPAYAVSAQTEVWADCGLFGGGAFAA